MHVTNGKASAAIAPSHARATLDRVVDRFFEAERMLVAGSPGEMAERALASKWGMRPRQARRYLTAVRAIWKREGQRDRNEKRDEMRGRIRALTDAAARGEGREHGPDYGAVSRLLELECRFDGLLDQPGGATINVVGDSAIAALSDYFTGGRIVDTTGEDAPK